MRRRGSEGEGRRESTMAVRMRARTVPTKDAAAGPEKRTKANRRAVIGAGTAIVLGRTVPATWAFGLGGKQAQNSSASEYERMMEQMKSNGTESESEGLSAESMYSPCPEGYQLKMRKSVSSAQCLKYDDDGEEDNASKAEEKAPETNQEGDPEDGYIVNGVRITFATE